MLDIYHPSVVDKKCYMSPAEYTYPPLTKDAQDYLPPKADHFGDAMCDCNTVMYRYEILSHEDGRSQGNVSFTIHLAYTWPALRVRGAKYIRKILEGYAGTLTLTVSTRWKQWIPECASVHVSQ